jgi:hypothetical protein
MSQSSEADFKVSLTSRQRSVVAKPFRSMASASFEVERSEDSNMASHNGNITEVEVDESNALLPSSYRVHRGEDTEFKHQRFWHSRCFVVAILLMSTIGCAFGAIVIFGYGYDTHENDPKTITVEIEGKHKKKHPVHSNDDWSPLTSTCNDGHYSKRTMKRAYELPFSALYRDHKGQRKYEASSVVVVGNSAYAVCDSSWAISKFDTTLTPFASGNIQLGNVHREDEDSGYEALFHADGIFYVVRESIKLSDEKFHAVIEELDLGELDYSIKTKCSTEFSFEGDSKGFEGAIMLRDLNNELLVLGLCEGNHCSETKKNESGNGRLVAMRKTVDARPNGKTSCLWATVRMINVPSSANFDDYSGMTITSSGKVGISSQENSQFWVGQLLGQNEETGLWNVDEIEFDPEVGDVYDFPKNDNCETVYCNIEGVHWLNDDTIMAVSDKMKGRGKQDFICHEKDQSVHVFVLPD